MDLKVSPGYDSSHLNEEEKELVDELLAKKGYTELFKVQQKALDEGILRKDKNLIVIAPTASGKTLCAELLFYRYLKKRGKVVYIVPTSSLVKDKEKEFKEYLEGEYQLDGAWNERDLLITSFESFYRTALLNTNLADAFGIAVIDEFHILYDKYRGFTLEKIITLLKNMGMKIICISATFEDRNEVAGWLDADIIDVPNELRKIPLAHSVIHVDKLAEVYPELIQRNLSPYIIFCGTRASCRSRARDLSAMIIRISIPVSDLIEAMGNLVSRILTSDEYALCNYLSKGVGFHHSGLHADVQAYVRELFLDRKLDFLFTTTGLAYGVNLPARSTVLFDFRRYDSMLGRAIPIPVHEYLQMAGRAGRPKWDEEGDSFIVVSNLTDKDLVEANYFTGVLSKAISHMTEDAYFRKAVLELIHSGRRNEDEIMHFFENTFYNYQATNPTPIFSTFNLLENIKGHIGYLENNEFMTYLGRPGGYQLTAFGSVTMNFLFTTFSIYDLDIFIELRNYIDGIDELKAEVDLLLLISTLFSGARLTKSTRRKVESTERFFGEKGIHKLGHAHYSTYAILNGWIRNRTEQFIEDNFKVYTSNITATTKEINSLLQFTEDLAKITGTPISDNYDQFKKRIEKGYNEEQVIFYDLPRFGRNLLRELYEWCHSDLVGPPYNCRGTMWEMLLQLKALTPSEAEFIRIVSQAQKIRSVRSKNIYDFIEERT